MLYENSLESFNHLKKIILNKLAEVDYNENTRKNEYMKLEKIFTDETVENFDGIFKKINSVEEENEKILESLLKLIDPYIDSIKRNCENYRESMANYYIEKIINEKNIKNQVCICKMRIDEGDANNMVACDGKECDIVWYHLKCIDLTEMPLGSWLCENCSKK